jgi:hypothetical protein
LRTILQSQGQRKRHIYMQGLFAARSTGFRVPLTSPQPIQTAKVNAH